MQAQGKETRVSGMGVPKGTSCGGQKSVCLLCPLSPAARSYDLLCQLDIT